MGVRSFPLILKIKTFNNKNYFFRSQNQLNFPTNPKDQFNLSTLVKNKLNLIIFKLRSLITFPKSF